MEIITLAARFSRIRGTGVQRVPTRQTHWSRNLVPSHPYLLHVKPGPPANLTRRWFAVHQERPFKILGLQQVAIGGIDKKALSRLWTTTLGVEKTGSYESKSENVCEDILKLGQGVNAVEIDLMEPLDPEKTPRVHVPALNHIGLWVHPLPQCVEWLTQQGMRFTPGGIREGAGGHDVAFIHPKGDKNNPLCGEGVLIELVQAPPEVVAHAEGQ